MAAHRHGILEAIVPRENEKDLADIPDAIKKTMKIDFVESMDQVLKIALEREVVALPMAPVAAVDLPAMEQGLAALGAAWKLRHCRGRRSLSGAPPCGCGKQATL